MRFACNRKNEINQQMNAKFLINENFEALPKYNFAARSFETK